MDSFKQLHCGCNMLKDDFQAMGHHQSFQARSPGKHVGMRFWVTKRDGQEKILNLVGSCPEKVDKLVIDLVRSRIKRWHTSHI